MNGDRPHRTLLDHELDFYQGYDWCLHPWLTVKETVARLHGELDQLGKSGEPWHTAEVKTNIYLLSCALLDSVDEYLRGPSLRVPKRVARVLPLSDRLVAAAERMALLSLYPHAFAVRRWRGEWQSALDAFVRLFIAAGPVDPPELLRAARAMASRLSVAPLPPALWARHTLVPSAFRKQDLTHFDVLALGQRFVTRFPDREQPILVIGIRTAGSYFAPLLRAFLAMAGYRTVEAITVRPSKGLGRWERTRLAHFANEGYLVALIDDPPRSGETLGVALDMLRSTGFPDVRLVALFPINVSWEEWGRILKDASLLAVPTVFLEPTEWYKHRLLEPSAVASLLAAYYRSRGHASISVVESATAERWNEELLARADDPRRNRLKRVYELRLETSEGRFETRYALAKSVGWGWLAYHSFIAGHRLAPLVPPILGLRDGILFTEWLPQPDGDTAADRAGWIAAAGSYIAARVRHLPLDASAATLSHQPEGLELLYKVLGRAYGRMGAGLLRSRVARFHSASPCPFPTLIDGRMRRPEWIVGPGLLKSDFEHHGMGKNELNVVDPAFDLADTILSLALSAEEEHELLRRYVDEAGDVTVQQRLFVYKLLAGIWSMAGSLMYLDLPQSPRRQQELHQRYVSAWDFLTGQSARFCGSHSARPDTISWRSPLVVLDVDGVIDRRMFGFPSTTAAGIRALSLLHAHAFPIVINTARHVAQVREYCAAYHLAGGIAEYGSYAWDAVKQQGRILVTPESLAQMDTLKRAMAELPGVYLNDGYQFSIRANAYVDGRTVPLAAQTVERLLSAHGLDRLTFFHTRIDTTVLAKEVDKGTGLTALLEWAGQPQSETLAIGDSIPDLAMFRVATRSYAPSHIGCRSEARSLGCRIDGRAYQAGLLSIVRGLVHPDGSRCARCAACERLWPRDQHLFLDVLEDADLERSQKWMHALRDPESLRYLLQSERGGLFSAPL